MGELPGTVAGAFQRVVAEKPDQPALQSLGNDDMQTWAQLGERVRTLAGALSALGVGKGDTVAMMLPNVPELHAIDYAAIHLGAVPFTIYNSSSAEQIAFQLGHADCRVAFTSETFMPRVLEAKENLPQLEHVIDIATLESLPAADGFDFDATWQAIDPEDLVTLIYTSGTTGPPKGAQWAHRTVVSQLEALGAVIPLPTENVISVLPMAHAGGRITAHYMALAHGAAITCCPDMQQLMVALGTVHPDALFMVPRVWEKLQVGIENMAAQIEGAPEAIEEGKARARAGDPPGPIPEPLLPILTRLGLDRIKAAFVGGAPSAPELSEFFRAVGVPMLEAYGSTECSLNVFNRIEEFKGGTAGKPLPGVEMRVEPDGELLFRSPLNMVGYRDLPEVNAETIDADGWLHTGDIGEVDEDGFVKIVDRKKEIIISSAGKNMSPANIEQAIKGETSLIGQIVTIGDGRKFNTALITLDPEAAAGRDVEELRPLIDEAVERGNAHLSRVEQIKKYTILPDVWLPDSDELTPTMKLKRKPIAAKYAAEIEALYAE